MDDATETDRYTCGQGTTSRNQELPLVHFSAQSEPFLSLKPPSVSLKKCSRQAEKGTSISP